MRLSQEFKVPIASIQHAHEAWFSIETLKQFYGIVPSVAMFSTSSIYKVSRIYRVIAERIA